MKKRKFIILVLCVLCFMFGSTVYAETVSFTVTVGNPTSPDPLSKRAIKADSEQRCYVTTTGMTGEGYVYLKSKQLNGSVVSEKVYTNYQKIGVTKTGNYKAYAKPGVYYYMKAFWRSGPKEFTFKGRYTP